MKTKVFIVLLIIGMLLSGCNEVDNTQKFKKAIEEIQNRDFYHTKESIVWTTSGVVELEQEVETYYSMEKLYFERKQDETFKTCGVCVDDIAYISKTEINENYEWKQETDFEKVYSYNPWLMQVGEGDNFLNDEYISYQETNDGVIVMYDRAKEIGDTSLEYHVTAETYYFDKDWSLLKVEMVAQSILVDEEGNVQEAKVVTTTEFLNTSKQEIEKKINDVFSTTE